MSAIVQLKRKSDGEIFYQTGFEKVLYFKRCSHTYYFVRKSDDPEIHRYPPGQIAKLFDETGHVFYLCDRDIIELGVDGFTKKNGARISWKH